ncbi:MAG TPA: SurA N-terminal domain-containing protein [Chthoniobacteraceae bacterium]
MVNLIRRFQQPLMILVTILIIIAFAWLYNDTRLGEVGSDRVGTIYGRTITQTHFSRIGRTFDLARGLQMNDLVKNLAGFPEEMPDMMIGMYPSSDEMIQEFVWNSMVLRHEADLLGITSTQAERDEAIKKMPVFQTNGVFDINKLKMFVANALAPRGLTEAVFEELVGDHLTFRKLRALLGSTHAPAPSEVRAMYELQHGKRECYVIRWNQQDFLKDQQLSEEDVKKAFEERKTTLLTEEQRKVKFVAFTVPTTDQPLAGKERVEALGKLSDQAEQFSAAMAEKDAKLEEVAARFKVKVEETPLFTASTPPPAFSAVADVTAAAFKLTKDQPNSDAIQAANGYYLMQLAELVAPREQTFEEAKGKLAETLKEERSKEAMALKTTEARNKILAELKAGKSFEEAATAAGVKAEAFPAFSFSEPPTKERDARDVMQAVSRLEAGELSEFVETEGGENATEGGLLVYLAKKLPVEDAKFEQEKGKVAEQVAQFHREGIFRQWLKQRRAASKLQTISLNS